METFCSEEITKLLKKLMIIIQILELFVNFDANFYFWEHSRINIPAEEVQVQSSVTEMSLYYTFDVSYISSRYV